ncbi:hypothetical protein [Schumannella sp. 10F1B-5-1]|uniref:hypothetical protein n=1 Tax=Schumannella sp. 10F1B-5-1 TaxID=2590780 RepID=UPI00112FF92B|nr:hypothetical protein [Schumannella sp. 10F1B-5-1]TPW73021.1 hypothetical protein FJ658_07165 [Schumannella sp. 10F1B-5-1]
MSGARFAEVEPRPARLVALTIADVGLALMYGTLIGLLAVIAAALLVTEVMTGDPARVGDAIARLGVGLTLPAFAAGLLLRFLAGPVAGVLLARDELRRLDARPELIAPRRQRALVAGQKPFDGLRGLLRVLAALCGVMLFVTAIVFLMDPDDDPEIIGIVLLVMAAGLAVCILGLRAFRGGGPAWWRRLRDRVQSRRGRDRVDAAEAAEAAERADRERVAGAPMRLEAGRPGHWLTLAVVRGGRIALRTFLISGGILMAAVFIRQPCRTCSTRYWSTPVETFIDVLVLIATAVAIIGAILELGVLVLWIVRRRLRRGELAQLARLTGVSLRPSEISDELSQHPTAVLLGMGGVAAALIAALMLVPAVVEMERTDVAELAALHPAGVIALVASGVVALVSTIAIGVGHVAGVRFRNGLRARWTPGDPMPPRPATASRSSRQRSPKPTTR